MHEQTVYTQNAAFDQSLHCLPFIGQFLGISVGSEKRDLFKF